MSESEKVEYNADVVYNTQDYSQTFNITDYSQVHNNTAYGNYHDYNIDNSVDEMSLMLLKIANNLKIAKVLLVSITIVNMLGSLFAGISIMLGVSYADSIIPFSIFSTVLICFVFILTSIFFTEKDTGLIYFDEISSQLHGREEKSNHTLKQQIAFKMFTTYSEITFKSSLFSIDKIINVNIILPLTIILTSYIINQFMQVNL